MTWNGKGILKNEKDKKRSGKIDKIRERKVWGDARGLLVIRLVPWAHAS